MQLQKATRKKSKMRLNISGASGSGKTYSALLLAQGLVGDWNKIAVIDTEAGSASLYEHLGGFSVIDLQPPYTPERYIQAIDLCIKSGIECVIIDSSTHEWSGAGGCLEINENLAQLKYRGNSWSAWNETTPRHDSFVNKVLQSPIHIVTCTRSKTETVMGEDKKVKKVGMKDIQREGWEYELTVSLNLDRDSHKVMVSKDRTGLFEGKEPFVVTPETGKKIKEWCDKGVEDKTTPAPTTQKTVTSGNGIFTSPDKDNPEFYNQWQAELDKCKKKHELMHLYGNHEQTILQDVKLREMFKTKQSQIQTS